MTMNRPALVLGLLAVLPAAGCLSLSNEGPILIERMDPLPTLLEHYDGSTEAAAGAQQLVIARTSSGSQIGELLRVRRTEGLTDYSDTMRWGMAPVELLDIALANGMYEKSGWRRGGPRPVNLMVNLQRFEVDLLGDNPRFVLDAAWTLRGMTPEGATQHGRFVSGEPIGDRSAAEISKAAAAAIRDLIDSIPDGQVGG